MAFDRHSKVEIFPPFPEVDMQKYEENYEKGIFDYEGITRNQLRGPEGCGELRGRCN
jgi:hypothetical protein